MIERYLDCCYLQCFKILGELDGENLENGTDSRPHESCNLYTRSEVLSNLGDNRFLWLVLYCNINDFEIMVNAF